MMVVPRLFLKMNAAGEVVHEKKENHGRRVSEKGQPPVSVAGKAGKAAVRPSRQHIGSGPMPSSQPVVIPQRSRTAPATRRTRTALVDDRAHKPDALPQSMAALLAVTAIPQQRPRREPGPLIRHMSLEDLVEEWKKDLCESPSLGKGSPLDFLLEPAGSSAGEDDTSTDEEHRERSLSSRSTSSDCISLSPSLDTGASAISTWSTPPTPTYGTTTARPSPRKILNSPPQTCLDDHPLLHTTLTPPLSLSTTSSPPKSPLPSPPSTSLTSTLTSNLTASLSALRNRAVRTLSNFSAPALPSDDILTRSLFSARVISEMRPKPRNEEGPADPALRRYLNPPQGHHHHHHHHYHQRFPPRDFARSFHAHAAAPGWDVNSMGRRPASVGGSGSNSSSVANAAERSPSPMIPLQTYTSTATAHRRSASAHAARTRPTVGDNRSLTFASAGPEVPAGGEEEKMVVAQSAIASAPLPYVRQREPRENSDFLRIIVLEMNMRRCGKLDPNAKGKARVWLPPRKGGRGRREWGVWESGE